MDADDGLKLARYLVEDDEQAKVVINFQMMSSVPRVRSILRKLLDNYQ